MKNYFGTASNDSNGEPSLQEIHMAEQQEAQIEQLQAENVTLEKQIAYTQGKIDALTSLERPEQPDWPLPENREPFGLIRD